ncbi:[Fe-Fe] hydrogenase large subunit C-terminal domain-containing protein [uncultured Selenomonas sp.]|uniref:[Fe-Fe] hydrogenase large subunit C-terminal domain-containing protein n=1 Tax=uncultured Selenomonas sp. TaxID=159275 RepID=UPI0025DE9E3D|nr:[Fe-Fe] hydrogenase large subunit C-terminal domain-containing protein [uncultured Selenomonas sp.]
MQEEGLVYTNENCIGCNKCVGVCSAMGACIAHVEGGKAQIAVDSLRCTACGACFGVCAHDARSYHDDTKRFFRDLGRGEPISLLISPALSAEYPELYGRILGTLRHLGAQRMLPVAFGADIYTWATLRYLDAHDRAGFISSRWPVIVSYIEHFHPELLSQMLPIQNPAMCMAIYARKRLRLKEKFAYIGPCIASSFDVQHKGADAYVSYNLTFQSLLKYLRAHGISEESCDEEIGYGLGLSYPAANGLASNLHWFLGDDIFVRVVSGKRKAYRWLDHNADAILGGRLLFSIIDIVNCSDGCLEGTAKESGQNEHDEAFSRLMQCIHAREQLDEEGPWSKRILPKERLALLNARFEGLQLEDYLRTFTDQSAQCQDWEPSHDEADAIYESMHKYDEASRHIDCSACGYDTCADMMRAIYNGFNNSRNCIHYEQAEADRLEKLSLYDELTGVQSHNAYLLATQYGSGFAELGTTFVMADVNGLKRANDTKGHAEGDRLLRTAAQCLAAVFGKNCVYRIGGDEFVAFVQGLSHAAVCARLAETQQSLEEFDVSVAFGTAHAEESATYKTYKTYKALKDEADKVMYKDKLACYARHGWKPRG